MVSLPASSTGRSRSTGGNLTVANNPMLPNCRATQLRDRLALADFDGTFTASANGSY